MHITGFWSATVSRAHLFLYSGADKKPLTRKDDSMSFGKSHLKLEFHQKYRNFKMLSNILFQKTRL